MIAPLSFSSTSKIVIVQDCSKTKDFVCGESCGTIYSHSTTYYHDGFKFDVQEAKYGLVLNGCAMSYLIYVATVIRYDENNDKRIGYASPSPIITIYMIDPTTIENFASNPSAVPFYNILKQEFDNNLAMMFERVATEGYSHIKFLKKLDKKTKKYEKKMGKKRRKCNKHGQDEKLTTYDGLTTDEVEYLNWTRR